MTDRLPIKQLPPLMRKTVADAYAAMGASSKPVIDTTPNISIPAQRFHIAVQLLQAGTDKIDAARATGLLPDDSINTNSLQDLQRKMAARIDSLPTVGK